MNELIFAFMMPSGILSFGLLLGGAALFRQIDDDHRSAGRLIDTLLFGAIVSTVYDIRTHWKKNREGRLCIYAGISFLIATGILAILRSWT